MNLDATDPATHNVPCPCPQCPPEHPHSCGCGDCASWTAFVVSLEQAGEPEPPAMEWEP